METILVVDAEKNIVELVWLCLTQEVWGPYLCPDSAVARLTLRNCPKALKMNSVWRG